MPNDSKYVETKIDENIPSSDKHELSKTTLNLEVDKEKGQRHINLIWELTQALIAVGVTAAIIFATFNGLQSEILGNAFTLILALYFVRTNHTKIGGVGGTDSSQSRASRGS